MSKMGNKLPEAELQQLMLNADVDGDGSINYEEFVAATVNLNKLEKEEHFVQVQLDRSICGSLCKCTVTLHSRVKAHASCIIRLASCLAFLQHLLVSVNIR